MNKYKMRKNNLKKIKNIMKIKKINTGENEMKI